MEHEDEDIISIMQEPPGGDNHGRIADGEHDRELNVRGAQAHDLMTDANAGWSIVDTSYARAQHGGTHGYRDAGMSTHRGVLEPGTYIGPDTIEAIAGRMGSTVDEIRSIYARDAAGGPLPVRLRARRDALDIILGGCDQIALLARVLECPEQTLQRAAKRGRAARVTRSN